MKENTVLRLLPCYVFGSNRSLPLVLSENHCFYFLNFWSFYMVLDRITVFHFSKLSWSRESSFPPQGNDLKCEYVKYPTIQNSVGISLPAVHRWKIHLWTSGIHIGSSVFPVCTHSKDVFLLSLLCKKTFVFKSLAQEPFR